MGKHGGVKKQRCYNKMSLYEYHEMVGDMKKSVVEDEEGYWKDAKLMFKNGTIMEGIDYMAEQEWLWCPMYISKSCICYVSLGSAV